MPSNLYENPILEIIMINTTAKIMELDFFMINNDFVFFNKNGIKRVQKIAHKSGSEIKIEAIKHKEVCFGEFHIHCAERFGETKLLPWRDGVKNMLFLFKHWITSIVFSVFSVFSSL